MARRKASVRPSVRKVKKVVRRARKPAEAMKPEDVAFLFDRLQAEERSERVWSEMTGGAAEEGESWHRVEEHLLSKASAREDHQRRWKFFGK